MSSSNMEDIIVIPDSPVNENSGLTGKDDTDGNQTMEGVVLEGGEDEHPHPKTYQTQPNYTNPPASSTPVVQSSKPSIIRYTQDAYNAYIKSLKDKPKAELTAKEANDLRHASETYLAKKRQELGIVMPSETNPTIPSRAVAGSSYFNEVFGSNVLSP